LIDISFVLLFHSLFLCISFFIYIYISHEIDGALYGNLSTIKTLVIYGGKPSSKNNEGKTPSMIATERGADEEITTFLFTVLEEENRIAYLADLEGRKLENAALAAETKLEKEMELKAKKDKFSRDTKGAYDAWKNPPAVRGNIAFFCFVFRMFHHRLIVYFSSFFFLIYLPFSRS